MFAGQPVIYVDADVDTQEARIFEFSAVTQAGPRWRVEFQFKYESVVGEATFEGGHGAWTLVEQSVLHLAGDRPGL